MLWLQVTPPAPVWQHPQVVAAVIQGLGTIAAALIVGVAGAWLTKRFARERDRQDRESQWRMHAVELTKLDMQRKLACRKDGDARPRPPILDFLANYRDLQELGARTPRDLYQTILQTRIATGSLSPEDSVTGGDQEEPPSRSGSPVLPG